MLEVVRLLEGLLANTLVEGVHNLALTCTTAVKILKVGNSVGSILPRGVVA